jgi:hypothetical protein
MITPYAGKYRSVGFRPLNVPATAVVTTPYRRSTERPPSRNGGVDTAWAPAHTVQKYTGTACIGISTMHKSNAVPVFNQQQAVETATMRRG